MEEIVQYYVVNKELNMSAGKIAAQAAHAATIASVDILANSEKKGSEQIQWFSDWYTKQGMKKIVLKGTRKDLENLEQAGFYSIRDSGLTEIEKGSLTVVALPPMPRDTAKKYTKHLSLY